MTEKIISDIENTNAADSAGNAEFVNPYRNDYTTLILPKLI